MKTNLSLLIILLGISSLNVNAQCSSTATTFQKTYGGTGNENAHEIEKTFDGGYVMTGKTTSFGSGGIDIFVTKFDANFNIEWNKTYGGSGNEGITSAYIHQTSDSGYIVCESTQSFGAGSNNDGYIFKINAQGVTQWASRLVGSNIEYLRDVVETSTGDLLIVGTANSYGTGNSDGYLIKVSSFGSLLWTKTFGGSSTDHLVGIIALPNDNYLLSGSSVNYGPGTRAGLLIKVDVDGNVIWSKTYGGSRSEIFNTSTLLSDGNIASIGYSDNSSLNIYDILVTKTDTNGNIIWSKLYGSASDEKGFTIKEHFDGNLLISSYSAGFSSNNQLLLIKTDPLGTPIISKTYGGTGSEWLDSWGYPITITPDSGVVIVGGSTSFSSGDNDVYIIKTNKCLESLCNEQNVLPTTSTPTFSSNDVILTISQGGTFSDVTSSSIDASFSFAENTICSSISSCSSSSITFQKTLAGTGNENAHEIEKTFDGGYVMTGKTTSFGSGGIDIFVTKFDANFNIEWNKTYGGSGNEGITSAYIHQTSDSGYIVCESTQSFGAGSNNDGYIFKINAQGVTQWASRLIGSNIEYLRDVVETSNGDLLIVGTANSYGTGNSDGYLIKVSSSGTLLWTKTFGGSSTDHLVGIIALPNDNYLLSGSSVNYGPGTRAGLVIKVDVDGNAIWSKTYGGSRSEIFNSSTLLSDGNIVSIGFSDNSSLNIYDILVTKIDTNGNILWSKLYGSSSDEKGFTIKEHFDGGLLISSYSAGFSSGNQLLLIKTDSLGTPIISKTYGGSGSEWLDNWSYPITIAPDSGVVIVGGSTSFSSGDNDVYIIKTNKCLESLCNEQNVLPTTSTPTFSSNDVVLTISQGGTFSDVTSSSIGTSFSFAENTICDSILTSIDNSSNMSNVISKINVYPNPALNYLNVKINKEFEIQHIELYSITGQKIDAKSIEKTDNFIQINISNLSEGLYFLKVYDRDKIIGTSKFFKM